LIGKSDYDFFPKEQADFFTSVDRRVLQSGTLLEIPEEVIQTRQGVRFLHTKKIPIWNSHGRPVYLLGISEDITERKRSEAQRAELTREQLARAEAEAASREALFLAQASSVLGASLDLPRSLALLAEMSVPLLGDWCVIELDRGGRAVTARGLAHVDPERLPLLRELLERSELRPAGLAWPELPEEQVVSRPGPSTQAALPGGDARGQQLVELLCPRQYLMAALDLRGQRLGYITFVRSDSDAPYALREQALCRELADRVGLAVENTRLYIETQAAVRVRDAFVAVAAHELKTPLTTLQLTVQNALRAPETFLPASGEHNTRMLRRVERQVNRLSSLVDTLLDVSRLSTRRVSIERSPLDLVSLVRDVVERLSEPLAKAGCSVRIQGDAHVVGRWDMLRLSQVITNLLSNSIKYGGGRPIEVTISKGVASASLTVRDHGIGIAAEHHGRIFNQFERAVSDRNYGGLGLGLWIAHQVVAAHGGTIQVDSRVGEGATFTVVLPLSVPEADEEQFAPL
jgi:signal transduction histidine kinase